MTCVAGWIEDGEVWMAADSAGTASDWQQWTRKTPKMFRKGDMLIGVTGTPRVADLLHYRLTLPEHPEGMDAHEYLATLLVDALRACLKGGGAAKREHEIEDVRDESALLVGYRGRLFAIYCDYQVSESFESWDAVGCGRAAALGALHALANVEAGLSAYARLSLALGAAVATNAGVRGPFLFERLSSSLNE